ncbi:unnamed protein product [Phytophthora fragariaefolia]|uniref:non-specific serine/threonine protein kinase n=1 Tax=Phytophthora fragariaefolia TaxID=1490495 RepID=A0A9W7D4T8_9STRA|nr:unnamed protein product [Phytophthora fragariaefolia]
MGIDRVSAPHKLNLRQCMLKLTRPTSPFLVFGATCAVGGEFVIYSLIPSESFKPFLYMAAFWRFFSMVIVDVYARKIFQTETLRGLASTSAKSNASYRARRTGHQRRCQHCWIPSLRRFLYVYRQNVPVIIFTMISIVYVHVLSQFIGSSGQWGQLAFSSASIVLKLMMQELAKHLMIVVRRPVSRRVMIALVSTPTILVDTQVRILLLRQANFNISIAGTLFIAAFKVVVRATKSVVVQRQTREPTQTLRRPQRRSSSRHSQPTLHSPITPMQVIPVRKVSPTANEVVHLAAQSRLTSTGETPTQYKARKDTMERRQKLRVLHAGEAYADMYAEYIAIGCSFVTIFFFGNHPQYEFGMLQFDSSDQEASFREQQLVDLGYLQICVEVVVDLLACVVEASRGVELSTFNQNDPFLIFFLSMLTFANVAISAGLHIRCPAWLSAHSPSLSTSSSAMAPRDAEWRQFFALCGELRAVKGPKGASSAVEKLQNFLRDDRARQLVHRWRSWGFLLNSLLHVLREDLRALLGADRRRKLPARAKAPQLRYWHYLRTELATAHTAADGPLLHLDPNGRDCVCQLLAFAVAVIDRKAGVELERSLETRVDKEAWLTVEHLVQFRAYCAVLEYKDWENVLELALGSISENDLVGDAETAATRARVVRLLLRNCPFDLNAPDCEVLPKTLEEIQNWFEAAKSGAAEREADSLLLVLASTLMETLTDLMNAYFGSVGPYLLKRGITVVEFIVVSNKARKNKLRGAPAEFLMQFLKLYQHNATAEPALCYLPPAKLLREMKKLIQVAMGAEDINLLMAHFNSARERRLGNALGIDDQGIRHLACTADIIFYHDCLLSDCIQSSGGLFQDEDLFDPVTVGSKRPRSISTVLAWETIVEQFYDCPRSDTQYMTASCSASPASQRHSSSVSYLSRSSSQAQRSDAKQTSDSGACLLLLLSMLSRHGDYYVINRIGDLMMVLQKLGDMLVVKEMGSWQALTLQILIQMAALSARHREGCEDHFTEHWSTVWRNLLRPELPLVPLDIIEASSAELWQLPAFRQPSSDTAPARGDSMRPLARTSMTSICTLLSLLHHVQLPVGADTSLAEMQDEVSQIHGDGEFESVHESVHLRLLRSLFEHLRAQVFRRNTIMGGSSRSFTKVDRQTEISPSVYASAIQSFFGLRYSERLYSKEIVFTPELIRKLSARDVDECDSNIVGEELNGFGVAFCLLESGLDYLSMPFPLPTGLKPTAFPLPIQTLGSKTLGIDDSSWYSGVISSSTKLDDDFERIATPIDLLHELLPQQDTNHLLACDCFSPNDCAQSISPERVAALQTEIYNLFSDLLSEISSRLPSDGCNSVKGLRVLANSLDVGLVLAALYADEEGLRPENDRGDEGQIRLLPLLKQYFEIFASYLKPSVVKQAQQSQSMSESLVHILRRFYAIILVSQGRKTLEVCRHPSADPIDLRTPPDLRPSIRTIVNTLEESLACYSGGINTPTNSQTPTLPRSRTGANSIQLHGTSRWESTPIRPPSSQYEGQLAHKEWDAMDEGEEDDIARDRPPNRVLQKSIALWCFRVILLLKKDSGLSSVKKYVQAIQFDPDFALAVAVLLCGVPGSDSLEAFVKLIDYATEEGMRENRTLATTRGGNCRAGIFLSQVLSALLLAGSVHVRRKHQFDEQPPAILVECVKRHLQTAIPLKQRLRVLRKAELQCSEVFFRLNSREFREFEEACVAGLTDSDASVRFITARSLQSVYYMYPDGGEEIFRHFFSVQELLLDAPSAQHHTTTNGAADNSEKHPQRARQELVDPRLCMDICLSVLMSLYVSACSSQTALPEVLGACVEMASITVSLYGSGTPSLISGWLKAIARFYGYGNVSRLLDDHFCSLWHRFILSSHRSAHQELEDNTGWMKSKPLAPLPHGSTLLQQFPLSTLIGKELDASAHRLQFIRKLDMIFPIGVLHSFISSGSKAEGGRFQLVDEFVSCFSADKQGNEEQPGYVVSHIGEQLTTDLFAFSFLLLAHPDPELKQLAHDMVAVAEERAQASALTVSHLGHIASKMARFTVWNIIEGRDDDLMSQSDLWRDALKSMKEKYSEFDWKLVNMADLLSEFYILLLRTELYHPRTICAVECFSIFAVETREAIAEKPVLQRMLLSICFQSIKHLTVRNHRRIGRVLSLLIRESCECFMKMPDMFGKYLGFVVQEISDILRKCNTPSQQELAMLPPETRMPLLILPLSADDQAELERVIFALCNDLGSGLGKYALEIDIVPDGISASLDKLNVLIMTNREIVSSEGRSTQAIGKGAMFSHSSAVSRSEAKQYIQLFIQREHFRGTKFYNPVPCSGSLKVGPKSTGSGILAEDAVQSLADVRLSAATTSIDTLRGSSPSTRKLYGKLAHTLLYLSSSGTFGNDECIQERGVANLADALGEIGALDASECELSPAQHEGDLSRLYQQHFHRGALREIKTTSRFVMHESVLTHLCSLLFEGRRSEKVDPSVIEETLKTLKRVLNLDEGVAALARSKDTELKVFLEPFESAPPSNWSTASPNNRIGWDLEAKCTFRQQLELWTSAEIHCFEKWVCLLTSSLATESPDPVLQACSAISAMRVDMAVFLFPYAVESILRKPDDDRFDQATSGADSKEIDVTQAASRAVNAVNQGMRFILTGAAPTIPENYGAESRGGLMHSQPLQAVQLAIHTINFLRETEKARFVETNGRAQKKISASKGKGSKKSSDGSSPAVAGVNGLAYNCMIDVDLIAVARAAVRVNMPYSAMQYVEMWLEKQNGGKITSLSSLASEDVVSTLREILVEAYSFDSDDDGIDGVNDGRTLKSQLIKFNREGQYAKALPLYDVSLQFLKQQGLASEGMMNSNPPLLVEGMLTSLQLLGYNNFLQGYLQSLQQTGRFTPRNSGFAAGQALEHRYMLAWKNMQWEAVLPGVSTQEVVTSPMVGGKASVTNSFSHQQMFFQALRAIAHRDFKYLYRVTSKAKKQTLQSIQLSLHSFESTKDSYSALVYLQAIHEIEELAAHLQKFNSVESSSIYSTVSTTGFQTYSLSLNEAVIAPRQDLLTAMPLLERWQRRRLQIKNDYDKAESLISLEEVLLQVSNPSDGAQVLTKLYLDLASLSRKAGRVAVSYRSLLKLEQLNGSGSLSFYDKMEWQIQKAKLLWKQQEARSAIWTGKKVCSDLTRHLEKSSLPAAEVVSLQLLRVKVLTITGKWIASQRSESSQVIIEDFFQKATDIISDMETADVVGRASDTSKAHFALAEFMAAMYQQVSTRVTSREWLAGKKVVQARYDELQELNTLKKDMQNENRAHIHTLNKEVFYDMNERSKVEASVDQFLIGALCSYGKGLTLSPQAELDMVFRVLSLWFNNQRKADINRVFIEEVIDTVPSYKFVPLSYQIISRISSSSDTEVFQTALRKLVMKLSEQHPHHTLVQLIALKNSGDVEGKGAIQFRTNIGEAKAEGAKVYLAELMKTDQRALLESLDSMANAYVQLALFDTSEYHGQKKKIPLSKVTIFESSSGRSGTTPFDQCLRSRTRRGGSSVMPAVLTSHVAPQADLDYSSVVRMYSFEPQFSITDSGIHRPKIIYCYGSDGERYKQLVKGQDDTRQDLVIEQVFETMNHFLIEEKATRKRNLRLRTYRVVPLSPIAGVLEWVQNTTPWGSYLVSRTSKRLSAHERYHPHEWKHTECRQYLKNAPDKLPAFLEIQANFTPVFHHFFLEKFPDAAVWYHRRLAYTQSAAVTSIVGYILGIGDRHSQNILIHEETGELVHIDFGVVFDQGMALYTPETVPFRLTRDMVDGMGISGVDGVFSRCCEVTLQLLRKKSASVVTILEVFVHDPLYRWTLSPLKALRIQEGGQHRMKSSVDSRSSSRSNSGYGGGGGTGNTNEEQPADETHGEPGSADAAARALIRVKQKLEGYEDPNGSALSIEGQVKHLLSAAQDPHNLCKLFPGWAPWL